MTITLVNTHHAVKAAHVAALREVYPVLFGSTRITSIDITSKHDYGAYLYELRYRGDLGVVSTTLYEKFRSAQYWHYRSITLTHVDASGAIADQLHNNPAQLTAQGFYNELIDRFVGPLIVVPLAVVVWGVSTGKIPYKLRNRPRSVCTYVEILIDDLAPYAIFHKEYPQ